MIDNMNGVQMASYLDGKLANVSKFNTLFIYITPTWNEEGEFTGFEIDGLCSEVNDDTYVITDEERFIFDENPLNEDEVYDLLSNLRTIDNRRYKVQIYASYHGNYELRRYYRTLMKVLALTEDFEMEYEWG